MSTKKLSDPGNSFDGNYIYTTDSQVTPRQKSFMNQFGVAIIDNRVGGISYAPSVRLFFCSSCGKRYHGIGFYDMGKLESITQHVCQ